MSNRKLDRRPRSASYYATVLHQLGLDSHRLEVPGRKRLEIDYGQPIRAIIA